MLSNLWFFSEMECSVDIYNGLVDEHVLLGVMYTVFLSEESTKQNNTVILQHVQHAHSARLLSQDGEIMWDSLTSRSHFAFCNYSSRA